MAEQSLPELIRDLRDGTRDLIREELQLARAEIHLSVEEGKRGAMWLVLALVPALMALIALPLALVFGLDNFVPRWAAALVTSGIMLLIAGIIAFIGVRHLRQVRPVPKQTVETVREDVEWMRNRLS